MNYKLFLSLVCVCVWEMSGWCKCFIGCKLLDELQFGGGIILRKSDQNSI